MHTKQTTRWSSHKTHASFGIYNYFKIQYGLDYRKGVDAIVIIDHCQNFYKKFTDKKLTLKRVDKNGVALGSKELLWQTNRFNSRMFSYISNHWTEFRNYLSQLIADV